MQDIQIKGARILIVDDEPVNVRLLERLLETAGYTQVVSTTDARRTIALVIESDPDLILLDLHMPHLSGVDVLTLLGPHIPRDAFLPVLMLTADITREAKQQALSRGATDFLTKPFDAVEVVLRIKNLLQTRMLHLQLRNQNEILEQRVRERTRELESSRYEVLERLALAAEFRDDMTHEHTLRVGRSAALIAQEMRRAPAEVELIFRSAPLHDIGKIGIPDRILLKPGPLSAEEFAVMQTHTTIGARILADGATALMQTAEQLALTHHERWDGEGYPQQLRGAAIPLISRIVSVADVYDALVHARPYKDAWPADRALAELRAQRGHAFDPSVVEAFMTVLERESHNTPSLGA